MQRFLFPLFFTVFILAPDPAQAETAPTAIAAKAKTKAKAKATAPAPVAAPKAADEPEKPAKPAEVLTGIGKVVDDWKNLGWLAGVIALINLLMTILRLKPLNDYLATKDLKWLKPLIACVLGGLLGGFSVLQTGAPVLNSILAGFLAALGSVGFHELMDKLRRRTTKPQPA